MADEKDKVAKLEERLEKATTTFKEMKAQMEEKDRENAELKARIQELEDELTLNGGATEEVENLKARLEKAKTIFAEQKAKIVTANEINSNAVAQLHNAIARINELEAEVTSYKDTTAELTTRVEDLEGINADLYGKFEKIKEIVNA